MIDTTGRKYKKIKGVAERVGFEPTVRFPARSLSRRVLSTAQSPLRGCCKSNPSKASVFRQRNLANAAGAGVSSSEAKTAKRVELLDRRPKAHMTAMA
jgi:hypothetical protein